MTTLTTNRRLALAAGALLMSATLALPLGSRAATNASRPKAPYVNTEGFAVTSTSSVTLRGAVNPHGLATVYAFQFGTTTGYGAQTAPVSAGNGTTNLKVSQTINGLPPGAAYHYRLIATNGAGTTNGKDKTFTTKRVPFKFFQVAATPDPAVFGGSLSVSGILSGVGAANRTLALQTSPFPFLGAFTNTGQTTTTNAGGSFSFLLASPLLATQFRVVTVETPPVSSPVVIERVAVRVSLHLRSTGRPGFVRMYGAVEPVEVGTVVVFQLLRPGLPPRNVGSTLVRPGTATASRFSHVVHIRRRGLYRALVRVDNGEQVSGRSRAILIR